MPERLCQCGNKLSSMNRSVRCYECKGKDAYEKRRQAGQKVLDEAKAAGRVRLHSCISNIHDPMPKACSCRKFITFADAQQFVKIGRVVDFMTRSPSFFERAVVEKSKLKNPLISSVGSRVAIERVVVNSGGNQFDEAEITRMKQTVAEDQAWRKVERDSKIDIEHDIAIEEQSKLIVFVDEKEFEEMKQRSWGRPGIFNRTEERTSVGLDVSPRLCAAA